MNAFSRAGELKNLTWMKLSVERALAACRIPSVTVKAYRGTIVPVVAETEVDLECHSGKTRATVMVHKESQHVQHSVLLGTETLGLLGFYMTRQI